MAQGKVLIIDDEPAIRELVARGLSRHGLDCRSAADAQEALAAAAAELPALALVDLRLPGPEGTWLLTHFKERWPDMAVIMLTGVTEAATAVDCLKRGADDYLIKPVDLEELYLAVRRAMDRVRLVRENREYQRNLEKLVQERTSQLNQALAVVERTYQLTVAALVGPPRLEAGSAPALGSVEPPALVLPVTPPPAPAEDRQPGPAESPADGREIELSALRAAGELMSQGGSPLALTDGLGKELVERGAARFARFFLRRRDGRGLELVSETGEKAPEGLPSAEQAAATGATRTEAGELGWMVSAPIQVRGRAEGVWQMGGEKTTPAMGQSLIDRLAPFVGASLARERDGQEWRKTGHELELFFQLASATRYTLDLQSVAQFIMDSLHKIVDYEVAGLLLLDRPSSLQVQTRFPASEEFVERVRGHILNTLRLTCGVEPGEDLITRPSRVESAGEVEPPARLRSFINAPLTLGGAVVGLFHVSSGREDAFSAEDVRFLNRAAQFLAFSVQGIRDLLATVKGRVERMVDHMTDGVLMLDSRGEVVALNQAARTILKLDASQSAIDLAALTRALEFDPLALIRAERRALRRVVMVQGVPYQAQLSPVENEAGEIAGAVLAFRNYSHEQRVDEMKSEFVNVVSHEIRTPLTVIKNALDLLNGDRLGPVTADQARFLGLARRNLEQLIGLVNDLLDLSKIEAGKLHIALRPLNLAEPIEKAVSSFQPQAETKGVELESTLAGALPPVYGDEESLHRVLVNLIGNALKFTERGGRIRVDAAAVAEDSPGGPRSAVKITVSDSGVGIPSEHLESIFDKFQQLDRSRAPGVAGTGLGLPITRELVKAHHGRIWAESEPGRGSRFQVLIPVLGEEEILFRILDRDLERAERAKAALSLVVVRLLEPEGLIRRMGEDRYQALLDVVKDCAEKVTRRSTDHVELRRGAAELVAILPDTPREGGKAFASRLLKEVQAVTDSVADSRAEWVSAEAVFPEDGKSADVIYRLADEKIGRPLAEVL
jgi:signal transduction histidine kinase/ActR/RegA family two-component response regulator